MARTRARPRMLPTRGKPEEAIRIVALPDRVTSRVQAIFQAANAEVNKYVAGALDMGDAVGPGEAWGLTPDGRAVVVGSPRAVEAYGAAQAQQPPATETTPPPPAPET